MDCFFEQPFNRAMFPVADRFVDLYECTAPAAEKARTIELVADRLEQLEGGIIPLKIFCEILDEELAAMVLRCIKKEALTGPVDHCVQKRLHRIFNYISRLKTF